MYNWELKDWPNFIYKESDYDTDLAKYLAKTSTVSILLEGIPENLKPDLVIQSMLVEALKTSEIEGELLSREDVFSSIRKNLGFPSDKKNVRDQRALGISELVAENYRTFNRPLSKSMLFNWHKMLMKGNSNINKGKWRFHSEPMQVVSGTIGKEKVHFEAPPSKQVPEEMNRYIEWFNSTVPKAKGSGIKNILVRSAIAHIYFESIHPFEDGNGRIGRFLSEKVLSQCIGQPSIISLSKIIERNKKKYYSALKHAQKTLELHEWINYFIDVILQAQDDTQEQILFTIKKANFFDRFKNELNERQLKVIRKMTDQGPEGFEGGMTTKKYISITRTSKATATRDLQALAELDIFLPSGGGRSTSYSLNLSAGKNEKMPFS